MKKVSIAVGLIFISFSLLSQSYYRSYDHHDISVSYGLFTPSQFTDVNSPMLNDLFPAELYVSDNFKGSGAISITYRHMFKNENILWGFTAGMSNASWEIYNVGADEGELKGTYYTIALDWQYRWRNQGVIQMYSGLDLGYTFGQETLTPVEPGLASTSSNIGQFGYQINAVGARIGKKFGGYVEFGYGFKGIINLGLSLQLF
jgi:hypothetical protein